MSCSKVCMIISSLKWATHFQVSFADLDLISRSHGGLKQRTAVCVFSASSCPVGVQALNQWWFRGIRFMTVIHSRKIMDAFIRDGASEIYQTLHDDNIYWAYIFKLVSLMLIKFQEHSFQLLWPPHHLSCHSPLPPTKTTAPSNSKKVFV